MDSIIHGVAIASFDADQGNIIELKVPSFQVPGLTDERLADFCLPDGAHLVEDDVTFIVIAGESANSYDKADKLYGVAYFRNFKNSDMRRGAVQKSICLLSTKPFFQHFLPLMERALKRYVKEGDQTAPAQLMQSLNAACASLSISLFGSPEQAVNFPQLEEGEFDGASLSDLVSTFQENVLHMWLALLCGMRICVVGQPARCVSSIVTSLPLLIAPLHGVDLVPYAALTHMDLVKGPGKVYGSTNFVFELKSDMYDIICWPASGAVGGGKLPLVKSLIHARDKTFYAGVVTGLSSSQKGESWVRYQFRDHTRKVLERCAARPKSRRKLMAIVRPLERYARYVGDLEARKQEGANAENCRSDITAQLSEIRLLLKDTVISNLDRHQTLVMAQGMQRICKGLSGLETVDQALDADAVPLAAQLLGSPSAQLRKYSYAFVAELSVSLKGQLLLAAHPGLFDQVLDAITADRDNVQLAAASVLANTSRLYVGCSAILARGGWERLVSWIGDASKELQTRLRLVDSARNMLRFFPALDLPSSTAVDACMDLTRVPHSSAAGARLLLDLWAVEAANTVAENVGKDVQEALASLKDGDENSAQRAGSVLFRLCRADPCRALELCAIGGVAVVTARLEASRAGQKQGNQSTEFNTTTTSLKTLLILINLAASLCATLSGTRLFAESQLFQTVLPWALGHEDARVVASAGALAAMAANHATGRSCLIQGGVARALAQAHRKHELLSSVASAGNALRYLLRLPSGFAGEEEQLKLQLGAEKSLGSPDLDVLWKTYVSEHDSRVK